MARLRDKTIDYILARGEIGDHRDGDGLLLRVAKPRAGTDSKHGSVKWYLDYRIGVGVTALDPKTGEEVRKKTRKRRTLFLGDYPETNAREARSRVSDVFDVLDAGGDPHAALSYARAAPSALVTTIPVSVRVTAEEATKYAVPAAKIAMVQKDSTFEDVARFYHQNNAAKYTSAKHFKAWISSLDPYFKAFGLVPVEEVTPAMVLEPLREQWLRVNDTAQKNIQRLRQIFLFFHAATFTQQVAIMTPVDLAVKMLPVISVKQTNFNSMPYADVPAFFERLARRDALAARALQWIILTATRSQEARGALWDEIDFEARTWTIPGHRLKVKSMDQHLVFLSNAHLAFLNQMNEITGEDELIFPNNLGKMLSENAFRPLFRRMGFVEDHAPDGQVLPKLTMTAHGFRSSFRGFVEEMTDFDTTLAEMALAHVVGSDVERRYRRGAVRGHKMREMMDVWAQYVTRALSLDDLEARFTTA